MSDRIEFEDGSVAVVDDVRFEGSTLRRPVDVHKGALVGAGPSIAEQWVNWEAALWAAAALTVQHRARGEHMKADERTMAEIRSEYRRIKREWAER